MRRAQVRRVERRTYVCRHGRCGTHSGQHRPSQAASLISGAPYQGDLERVKPPFDMTQMRSRSVSKVLPFLGARHRVFAKCCHRWGIPVPHFERNQLAHHHNCCNVDRLQGGPELRPWRRTYNSRILPLASYRGKREAQPHHVFDSPPSFPGLWRARRPTGIDAVVGCGADF